MTMTENITQTINRPNTEVINSRNKRRRGHPICMRKKRNTKYFLGETEGICEILVWMKG